MQISKVNMIAPQDETNNVCCLCDYELLLLVITLGKVQLLQGTQWRQWATTEFYND